MLLFIFLSCGVVEKQPSWIKDEPLKDFMALVRIENFVEHNNYTLIQTTIIGKPYNVVVRSIKDHIKVGELRYMYLVPMPEVTQPTMIDDQKKEASFIFNPGKFYFWIQDEYDIRTIPTGVVTCDVLGVHVNTPKKIHKVLYGIFPIN